MTTYIALVHKKHKKNVNYGIIFPDFPDCQFGGKTIEDALKKAKEGIIFHIGKLLNKGRSLPSPASLKKIMSIPKNRMAIPSLINIIMPTGNLKRLNISMDMGLINEIDQAAKKAGKNRSEFLADAAKQIIA